MTLSLHVVADNCPPEQLDRALLYLKRVNPGSVDIAAGAQLDVGMQFVERVRAELPTIKIFWRNMQPEDTGIHAKMQPLALFNLKVLPFLDWFKRTGVIFVPDNESSGDDDRINKYVLWTVEHLVRMHSYNLPSAVCRFATGNIDDGGQGSNQYPLLKPIFQAMLPSDFISPNEYSIEKGNPRGSGGNLERYRLMWNVAGRPLPTVIGEAGVAMNYDPGKGYIDAGMSDEAYGQQLLDEERWYQDGRIDRHVYLIGGFTHAGYRLREGMLAYLESYYMNRQPPVIKSPEVIIRWIPTTARLKHGASVVNLRSSTSATSADLGNIKSGDPIEYDSDGLKADWWHVRYKGVVGYATNDYFEPLVGELPAEPPPPTLPEEPAEPPPASQAKPRTLNIRITLTATDEQWAQLSVVSVQLLNLCTGLFALIKAMLPQIVIEDLSSLKEEPTL